LTSEFRSPRSWLLLALAALVLHGLLWLPAPLVIQTAAVMLLIAFLPGLLFVQWLLGRCAAPPDRWEHLLYTAGAGYAWLTVAILLISYLPGAVTAAQLLLIFNGLTLALALLVWWRDARPARLTETPPSLTNATTPASRTPHWWWLLGLLILLAMGGVLRLVNLGYSELLTDEARAVLRAAAVLQGHEEVLFLHRKGPVEILLPAAIYGVTSRLDEASARLPFALANLIALLVVLRLGWQIGGPLVGWGVAFWLAVDGYWIGFARFVQYQSVVILTSALVVLILLRLVQRPVALVNYLALAAILAATGLLAHYDGAVVLVPIGLLVGWLVWQRWSKRAGLWRGLGLGGAIGIILLALFYLPFLLHPHFDATYAYLLGNRVGGGGLPYNNLAEITERSIVYSSLLYLAVTMLLLNAAQTWVYWRGLGRWWAVLVGVLILPVNLAALWRPDLLAIPAFIPLLVIFALSLGLTWLTPRLRPEERVLWAWWGIPWLAATFAIAQPGTHVYVVSIPAALLIATFVAQRWAEMRQRFGWQIAGLVTYAPAVLMVILVAVRAYAFFAYTDIELLHIAQNRAPYSRFAIDRLYGFPLANGWKAVGALYAEGALQGDFETNQRDDLIPDWYTHSQHRCATTANWYFAVDNLETWSSGSQDVTDQVLAEGYGSWGEVTVKGEPRLRIYRRPPPEEGTAPHRFSLEEYAPRFDALTSHGLPLRYPVIEETIAQPLNVNFDNQIRLAGYRLDADQPLRPGDTFRLTLYWRAQRPLDRSYKVFSQAFYGDGVMVAQQDGLPVCDRLPTNLWYPGELIADERQITVATDAPPGVYPLYTGLYLEENFSRLPVLDALGNLMDDKTQLTELKIE
jgi:hypothetical protein